MPTESAGTAVARAARAMLRGGLLAGGSVGLAAAAAGLAVSPRFAGSAALGAVLAAAALGVGPLLLAVTRTRPGPAVLALALAGYGGTVLGLGIVYVLLGVVTALSGDGVGCGLFAAAVGSVAGQLRAVARQRTLVFGGAEAGPGTAGRP